MCLTFTFYNMFFLCSFYINCNFFFFHYSAAKHLLKWNINRFRKSFNDLFWCTWIHKGINFMKMQQFRWTWLQIKWVSGYLEVKLMIFIPTDGLSKLLSDFCGALFLGKQRKILILWKSPHTFVMKFYFYVG